MTNMEQVEQFVDENKGVAHLFEIRENVEGVKEDPREGFGSLDYPLPLRSKSCCFWGFNKEFQQKFREARLTTLHVNDTVIFCSLTKGNWMKFKQTGDIADLNPDEIDRLIEIVVLQENSPNMETEDRFHLFPNKELLLAFQRELKSGNLSFEINT